MLPSANPCSIAFSAAASLELTRTQMLEVFLVPLLGIAAVAGIAWLLTVAGRSGERRRRERLLRETANGTATIIGLKATHSSSGEQPIVKFRLCVSFGSTGEQREIELDLAVHVIDAHRLTFGAVFPARFDPKQMADFSIDFGGVTGVSFSDFEAWRRPV